MGTSISFEGKSDDELLAIATNPRCPAEALSKLRTWLYKGGSQQIRTHHTHTDRWTIIFAIEEAIAKNPNTPPAILWGMLEDYSETILENPALPLLVLENPTLFSSRNFSLQSLNLPKLVLEIMLSNAKSDSEEIWSIQSHINYAGEVQSDEDYTNGLRFLTTRPINERYVRQLHEDNTFPKFLLLSENDALIWSPKETLIEVKRCNNNLNESHWDKIRTDFWKEQENIFNKNKEIGLVEILKLRSEEEKNNVIFTFLKNIYSENFDLRMKDAENVDEEDDYKNSSDLGRFSLSLNPYTPTQGLKILSKDANRYVRATAKAALEMR
jgi:hypothetical protein